MALSPAVPGAAPASALSLLISAPQGQAPPPITLKALEAVSPMTRFDLSLFPQGPCCHVASLQTVLFFSCACVLTDTHTFQKGTEIAASVHRQTDHAGLENRQGTALPFFELGGI